MSAGASAEAWAAEAERLRWWQYFAAAVGVETAGMARGRRLAARRRTGAKGERMTAKLLVPLSGEGWHVLPDRALPGSKANVDHLLVGPDGRAYTLDSKLWSARDAHRRPMTVHVVRGRLTHGDRDKDRQVEAALQETRMVSRALGVPVTPLIVMHNAPVVDGGFQIRGVSVFPAARLVELLRHNTGRPNPREARRLAELAAVRLPPYV